jgi:hypothetical protein
MNKGRVGEESKGKETDRCPLTIVTLAHCLSVYPVIISITPALQRV